MLFDNVFVIVVLEMLIIERFIIIIVICFKFFIFLFFNIYIYWNLKGSVYLKCS